MGDDNGRIRYSHWIIEVVFLLAMGCCILLLADMVHALFTL